MRDHDIKGIVSLLIDRAESVAGEEIDVKRVSKKACDHNLSRDDLAFLAFTICLLSFQFGFWHSLFGLSISQIVVNLMISDIRNYQKKNQ